MDLEPNFATQHNVCGVYLSITFTKQAAVYKNESFFMICVTEFVTHS